MPALTINKYYNFTTYAPSILGTSYNNAKLVSILDYDTALKFGNIELLHKQIYPYLPSNTPSDLTKYTYYLFKTENGNVILADYWLIDTSIQETGGINATINLYNIDSNKVSIIRDQLKLLGINFNITI
ncbi:MAG: hypothetical protein ACD_33C00008G0006 [uncultured bacterium]|nr:MAG: hypothetical protein ACD_33C00008G0006 [uncultured bacterium]